MLGAAKMDALRSEAELARVNTQIDELIAKYPIFDRPAILKLQTEFMALDSDGSGSLDKFEVMRLFGKVGEQIPKKAVNAIIAQYDHSGHNTISFPAFVAIIYGIQTGTLNASNPFLRAFLLQRASNEATIDMLRTSSSNLTELAIKSDLYFGQDGRIYDALKVNTRLTSLSLTSCGLQPHHAKLIAEGLLDNTSLLSLDLNTNVIEDSGFLHIAEALRMLPDSRDAWEQLNDARDEMNDLRKDYRKICREYDNFLTNLKANNGIILQQNNNSLVFRDSTVRRKFLALSQQKEDMLVDLEIAALRELDAKHYYENLKCNCSLKDLNCSQCSLFEPSGREMAITLAWNTTLTALNLARNSISAGGIIAVAESLAYHPSLTTINLEGNVFGAEGGQSLAKMLLTNTRLKRCDLADNSMADQSAEMFAQALKVNCTLCSLDLSGNLITADLGKKLTTVVRDRTKSGNSVFTQLQLLRNIISPEEQLNITHILGKDWKYKHEVQGISYKLRALPKADAALAALTAHQKAMIESAFHAFDVDGSGDIDTSELFEAVKMLELDIKTEDIGDMVKAFDKDGSGSIDLNEFTEAMAIMFAVENEAANESDDEVLEILSEEEVLASLMFASGVYDPSHAFPEAMKFDGAKQKLSFPALRMGYRILCKVERNISLSDKHQTVVARVLRCLGWDKSTLKKKMPYTARQLQKALSSFRSLTETTEHASFMDRDGGLMTDEQIAVEQKLESRLQTVEIPEDDQGKVDQALLWMFRGVPLMLDEDMLITNDD